MRPAVGAAIVGVLGVAQIGASAAVAAVIGKYLQGSFALAGSDLTVSCGLSMRSASACTAGFVTSTVSIILSLLIVAFQCATAEGRMRMGFCGPILSAVGFFWWTAYAATATAALTGAQRWDEPDADITQYRAAAVAISWACALLYMVTFFVSSAAAGSAARARNSPADPLASVPSKRFSQPMPSPPSSPCKSTKSFNSAYEPFESESPKKWAQPPNPRTVHCPVTSDGLRTLLLVQGEPVPLSPNLSPMHSPMAGRSPMGSPKRSPMGSPSAGRSPMHRALSHGAGSGSVGSFSTVLLPQGSQPV